MDWNVFREIRWGFEGFSELINVHPLFVPFPIALLLSSLAFYVLGIVIRKEALTTTGQWTLYLGTVAAAVTVWTGLQAEETVPHGGASHALMTAHEYLGFVILTLAIILSLWTIFSRSSLPKKGRFLFLLLHLLLALVVIQSSDLGGRMAFLQGVGVGRKSMLQQLTPDAHIPHEHSEHAH